MVPMPGKRDGVAPPVPLPPRLQEVSVSLLAEPTKQQGTRPGGRKGQRTVNSLAGVIYRQSRPRPSASLQTPRSEAGTLAPARRDSAGSRREHPGPGPVPARGQQWPGVLLGIEIPTAFPREPDPAKESPDSKPVGHFPPLG